MGPTTSEKLEQTSIVEEADDNLCDVLKAQSGKEKYSDAWLLDSGCTYDMCQKKGVIEYIQAF